MNIYIWEKIQGGLTDSYHDGGGCAVIAASLEDARALLPKGTTRRPCKAQTADPDTIYELAAHYPPRVFIFPDAGCC